MTHSPRLHAVLLAVRAIALRWHLRNIDEAITEAEHNAKVYRDAAIASAECAQRLRVRRMWVCLGHDVEGDVMVQS